MVTLSRRTCRHVFKMFLGYFEGLFAKFDFIVRTILKIFKDINWSQ